jgi:hypothetical protein
MEQNQQNQQENANDTLEDYINKHQTKWSELISEMNIKLKNFYDIPELQNIVYSERQNALDYYFGLLTKVASISKRYKKEYAEKYNAYKTTSQIRYSSDTAINAQVASDLCDLVYYSELLSNHAKYMQETIKTIDGIIYAINSRIEVEKLVRDYKK